MLHKQVILGMVLIVTAVSCTERPVITLPSIVTPTPVTPASQGSPTPQMIQAIPTWPKPLNLPDKYAIHLRVGTIDTRLGEPPLPDELCIDGYQAGEPGYYIVQFVDVILPEWRKQLDAIGITRLGYVPNNALLVRMTPEQRVIVEALDVVQWVGIYQPAYRISPNLPMPLEGRSTLIVLTFPGADFEGIKARLQDWGGKIEASSENEFGGKVRVTIDLRFVVPIARLKGVMWIEPWVEPELSTNP